MRHVHNYYYHYLPVKLPKREKFSDEKSVIIQIRQVSNTYTYQWRV